MATSSSPRLLWLNLARAFTVAIICLTIGLFIASIPINYEQRNILCKVEPCPPNQLTSAGEQALSDIGLSVLFFTTISISIDFLNALVCIMSAIVIAGSKPGDILTLFVAMMLVTFGMATFTGDIRGISDANSALGWLNATIGMLGNFSIIAFLFIFPSGRFVPRWTSLILIAWILFQLPRYYLPDSSLNLSNTNPVLYNILFVAGVLSGVATQIHRYGRVSDPIEKIRSKMFVHGLTVGMGGYIVDRLPNLFVTDPMGSYLPVTFALSIITGLLMLAVPVSINFAVRRYRLWDINLIIHRIQRTTVYFLPTFVVIFSYLLIVVMSAILIPGRVSLLISVLAIGLIAVLFQPLRERLQRAANRLIYGERDDPATVLTKLSQRLDSAIAPDSVLQTIVETLAQTLRLPYAAISLSDDAPEPRFASTPDLPPSELIRLPLTYRTERVGELTLAPRTTDEIFTLADMRLINLIAGQAGTAAHTVRLTDELRQLNADLQQSRERLVTAQEEERRRLRRDLHDGVGPTLASLSQRLDTASDLVNSDPQASVELLKDLKGQVKTTLAEIRRLVYALRPPALDEFGLVTAIREHVAPYMGPNGLQVTFDVTEPMPPLPAAVEVAAYRITLESFTNIMNHAQANACHIKIKLDHNSLLLEIADNGKGLSSNNRAGIGLTSMRERASELGGEFATENNPTGGTIVKAELPMTNAGGS